MKTVFAALGGAVGTTLACWRLILILWLVIASAAWVLSAPVRTEIQDTFSHSPMATGLLQAFDSEAFVDFWSAERDPVGRTSRLVRESAFGWIILWTILSAGVLARVADKHRFDGFLSACARYGHRFVWLLALSLVALWGVGWFNDHLSGWVTSALVGDDNAAGAGLLGWSMTLKTLFVLAIMGVVVTSIRFARLRVILLEERFVLVSWLRALASVVRHLPSIGLGRVLSLWPVVLAFVVYELGTSAVLGGWEPIPGLRTEWHLVLVMQLAQVLLVAALVYRMAVDARLWIIVAPTVELGAPTAAVAAATATAGGATAMSGTGGAAAPAGAPAAPVPAGAAAGTATGATTGAAAGAGTGPATGVAAGASAAPPASAKPAGSPAPAKSPDAPGGSPARTGGDASAAGGAPDVTSVSVSGAGRETTAAKPAVPAKPPASPSPAPGSSEPTSSVPSDTTTIATTRSSTPKSPDGAPPKAAGGSSPSGASSSGSGSPFFPDAPPPKRPDDECPTSGSGGTKGFLVLALALTAGVRLAAQDAPAAPATASEPPAVARSDDRRPVHRNAYAIDVTVDVLGRTVGGVERATFINETSKPVDELWMHLYASAFSNTKTIWIANGREDAIEDRGDELGGYLDVRSVRTPDGRDLADATSIANTLMRVSLDEPVPPGGRTTIVVEFETRFPHIIARMGQVGRHIDGMQWFPKFCAHGENGWRKRPFYRTGEFFADFGSYEVTFHYPETVGDEPLVLEATGVPGEAQPDGAGWLRRTFRADDVHDFAFCADTAFRRYEDTWEDPTSGRTVEVVYLCQPYAEPKAEQVLSVLRSCLDASATWWMPYPYPRLVVDGLPHSRGGGMEYPMLFTISQRFPNHLGWFVDLTEDPAGVTAHEFGHQYWYGILASDEVEEAWLDEGVNDWGTTKLIEHHWPDAGRTDAFTFLDRKLVREAFNGGVRGGLPFTAAEMSLQNVLGWRTSPFHDTPPVAEPARRPTLLGFRVPDVASLRLPDMSADRPVWDKARYRSVATTRPLSAPSRDFTEGYGGLVYNKTSLVLETLERHLGDEVMGEVMKTYVDRFAFDHPRGEDFLGVVSEVTDGAHDDLLDQLIRTTRTVDWSVQEVTSRKVEPLVGYTDQRRPGDPVAWTGPEPEGDGDPDEAPSIPRRVWRYLFDAPYPGTGSASAADAPTRPTFEDAAEAPAQWATRYVVRQLGQVEAPVEVEARFADGSVQRHTWDGVGGYQAFEHLTSSKLTAVVIDPDRKFILDLDVNNNGYVLQADHTTTRALAAYSHFWTQGVLGAWSLVF